MSKLKILMLGFAVVISLFSVASLSSAFAQETESEVFTAMLSGGEEVPPVTTEATGVASFNVTEPDAIDFSVNVTGMDKVTAAHIHSAKTGENGEVVVTLFNGSTTGPISGNLANGTIKKSSLEGLMQDSAVSDLVKAMERGETYVNVHTEANPNGEIRGQVGAAQ